jgi:predicted N-formylglutamate amidohydrolase
MTGHVALPGARTDILLVCDHASNAVPHGVELGLPPALMEDHIAVDIGAGPLTHALAARLDCGAHLGAWSRLVVDVNRPVDHPGLIAEMSDGWPVPGNRALSAEEKARRLVLHADFHESLAARIAAGRPRLLVSVHSFTPALASEAVARPWPVGILWNRDDRAASRAIARLSADPRVPGPVGANEPYSGRILNYTMDRHAEAGGIPYIGFEVRQDLLLDREGIAAWADILASTIAQVEASLC